MRALKIFGAIIGVLVVVIVIAIGGIWLGGPRILAWVIEHPASAIAGRQIRIGGPLTIKWGDIAHISATNVQIANAAWAKQPAMFTAKAVEVDFAPWSLIKGPTRIPRLSLDQASLLLETSKDGARNWDFLLGQAAAPKSRRQAPLLQHLEIKQSSLAFYNGETYAQANLAIANITFDDPGTAQPVAFSAIGAFQKQPLKIDGKFGPLNELRGAEKPYPVRLSASVGESDGLIEGTLQQPLDFSGLDLRVSLKGKDFDKLAALFGVPLPALPDFRGTAKLTGGNGRYALDALSLRLGESDLEGGLAIDTTGKVPYLRANLNSANLDLANFKGLYGGQPKNASAPSPPTPENSGRIIPDKKIELGKLPGLNADLTFDGTKVSPLGGTRLDRVSLTLQLNNGALTIAPLRFHTADGDVDLSFGFSPFTSQTPPRFHGEIKIQHVDLHKLLNNPQQPAMLRKTSGIAGGFAKLDSTGVSPRELLGHMSGDVGLFMQNGQLSELLQDLADLDVLEAIGLWAGGDKPVPIECMVVRLDVKDGIATPTTFLLDTTDTSISGSGTIDFAQERLDLTLEPKQKSFTVLTLRSPLKIGGTFAHPAPSVEKGRILARLGAALGLGVVFPPAALIPLIDSGLGEHNACAKTYSAQKPAPPLNGSPTK